MFSPNNLLKLCSSLILLLNLINEVRPFQNITNLNRINVPSKLSNCKAKLDDGSIIDLTSQDNSNNPRKYYDSSTKFTYSFNPCSTILCELNKPKTAAICQHYEPDQKLFFTVGDQNSVTFSLDTDKSLLLTYKSGQRTGIIKCVCDNAETFKFLSEDSSNTYRFSFSNKCCCPNKCNGDKPSSGGLSGGSILLIIGFSFLAVYFLGGFLFLKFVKKSNGIELIPNSSFWIALPTDIKGGFGFLLQKIRPGSNQYNKI